MNKATRRSSSTDHGGGRGILPWASLIGGGALAAFGTWRGMARRSIPGAIMAAAGGYLAYRGATAQAAPQEVTVEKSITVNTTPEEAYRFWHNFENFPRFMRHLYSVRTTGPRWSEWIARTPKGNISWTAEIIEDRESELISWRSRPDSEIENYGSVRFRNALDNKGCIVQVRVQYRPIARRGGNLLVKFLGKVPEFQIREDLRRFKALIEAGEIPTTEGQPSGRRSAVVTAIHKLQQKYAAEPHATREALPA